MDKGASTGADTFGVGEIEAAIKEMHLVSLDRNSPVARFTFFFWNRP